MAKLARKLDRTAWGKLPPAQQELYAEQNGSYFLDTDDAEELRTALEAERAASRAAKLKLAELGDVDAQEYQRLKEAEAKAIRDRDLEKGNYEKIRAEDEKAHQAALKKEAERSVRLQSQLEESLVDGELLRAYTATGADRPNLFMPAARLRVKAMEIGGRVRAVVLDEKGEPRLKAGAKAADEYMGPADLVSEMRNDKQFAGAFPATTTSAAVRQPIHPDASTRTKQAVVDQIAQQVRDGGTRVG